MEYYFAYGSNMDEEQMRERAINRLGTCGAFLEGHYSIVGAGRLDDYELKFNKIAGRPGIGYANVITPSESIVEGIVYQIDKNMLDRLDCKEGYPDHYGRKKLRLETKRGTLDCWVYIASAKKVKEGLKPTVEYLKKLCKGKPYLSDEYYQKLSHTETV